MWSERSGRGAWKKARRQRTGRGPSGGGDGGAPLREALLSLLERMGGTPERAGLQRLWDNWETALGAELAGLAQPLGHHAGRKPGTASAGQGVTLLVGAEDAMLLQELRFRSAEILERVNGFLGMAYFCEVKVSLPLGRNAPERSREPARTGVREEAGTAPAASGVFLAGMDGDSPVARCYARFAGVGSGAKGKAGEEGEEIRKK